MTQYISKQNAFGANENIVIIISKTEELSEFKLLNEEEIGFIGQQFENTQKTIAVNQYSNWVFVHKIDQEKPETAVKEAARKAAFEVCGILNKNKLTSVAVTASTETKKYIVPFAEGICLSNYQFIKYFKEKDKKENSLKQIFVNDLVEDSDLKQINAVLGGTYKARTLVGEPVIYMDASQIAKEMEEAGKEAGFSVAVFDKAKIESLEMGGLLGVNKGSVDPPTFTVMEWKPDNAVNRKPIVIVGKGIVFDTGGLSLKPTPNSMDIMKSDMGGAAATIGAMYSTALADLPVHVIGIVPATDNRPGGNAIAPGDVIKMHNGLSVEVLNTDAEGRLILADGLSYAMRYEPELTFDIATLTGAAARAIGKEASVVMGTASDEAFAKLETAGNECYERTVRFPLWEEYGEQITSDIADIKNLGGPEAGAITAGKFLERFVEGEWIHIDIAGPMWASAQDNYRGKGGTGVGVRLLFEFLRERSQNK